MAKIVDTAARGAASPAPEAAASRATRTGRPPAGAQSGGRQAIVASMQRFMRSHPLATVQRLQIAEYAGVTPALISYYFPEKLDLMIEAASPLVSTYTDRVGRILGDGADLVDRFRAIGHEFIAFNVRSGHALDYYIDATMRRKRAGEILAMSRQYEDLFSFMRRLVDERAVRAIEPAFLHSSLWSQCKYLGRQPHVLGIEDGNEAEAAIRALSDETFRLFTRGLLG